MFGYNEHKSISPAKFQCHIIVLKKNAVKNLKDFHKISTILSKFYRSETQLSRVKWERKPSTGVYK